MNHRHTFPISVHDSSINVVVDYSFARGYPATQEQPSEGDSVQIENVFVFERDGQKTCAPLWLTQIIEEDEEILAELLAEAIKDLQCAADDHADMLREERMFERD